MDVASCPSTTANTSPQLTDSSSNELRYPVATADGSIGDLVEHTNMHAPVDHDEESLAGSTYEFVDTDVESRDGHTTASIASTDVGRPDDVDSLADTDHSEDDESADEDNASEVSEVIPAASRSLEQTSVLETPSIGRSSAAFYDEPHSRSIEFEESLPIPAETVSVKHTVREYDEEMTMKILQELKKNHIPRHISLTIRQSMSRSGLTTREPLRVLFVGSHAARQDIVTKIGSCLSASNYQGTGYSPSQVYNVVPISASAEEVELMQSSGMQIKVEDCVDAESLPFEDDPSKPEIIRLRLENTTVYHSVPDGKSFIVEPSWELPHIAVFYWSSSDTTKAKQTRSLARRFMTRHGVPSLVITHEIILDQSLRLSLDQDTVHMCLEERNSKAGGNKIHHRLPIDLTSFLNIDARQMSRNLAYITGLSEVAHKDMPIKARLPYTSSDSFKITEKDIPQIKWRDTLSFRKLGRMFIYGFGPFFFIVLLSLSTSAYNWVASPSISVNSQVVQPMSVSSTSQIGTTPSITPALSSTSIQQVSRPSSLNIQVSTSARPNSLSVPPTKEVRVLPVASPESGKPSKVACSAEVKGRREILVRLPAVTQPRWLSRHAISVNITRGQTSVKTERVYSSDEGIVILLREGEAYGSMNLSITTAKKPKTEQTIQVDFGTVRSQAFDNFKSKMYSMIEYDGLLLDHAVKQAQRGFIDFTELAQLKITGALNTTKDLKRKASTTGTGLVESVKTISSDLVKRSTTLTTNLTSQTGMYLTNTIETVQKLREPARETLLKAQIQSKLTWLKMLGRTDEYNDYTRRAAAALKGHVKKERKCTQQVKRKPSCGKRDSQGRPRVWGRVPG